MRTTKQIPLWALVSLFALSYTTEATYTSALPSISKDLHVVGGIAQLSSVVYFLGFAIGILLLGRISDLYGRRPVVLVGLSIYILSSILSIFAADIVWLILLRFITAFGASIGSVIAHAMARDSYTGSELSYIYATALMWLAIIPSTGSAIGGYIVQYYNWRYIFVLLSLISFGLFIVYSKYLPETNIYIGISYEYKYYSIFKIIICDKFILCYALIMGILNAMSFGFYMEAPFIFIDIIGIAPSVYGKLAFLLNISSACGSFISRYLAKRMVQNNKIVSYGFMLSMVGCVSLMLIAYMKLYVQSKTTAIFMFFVPMMLNMIGHGLLIPIVLRHALADYTKVTGSAGSIFGGLYYLLVAIISLLISNLHSDNGSMRFTILFACLSISASFVFYNITRWNQTLKAF